MIIGLAGAKRCGKDTAARYLVEHHAFKQDSFAAPIRAFACHLLGLTPEQLEAQKEQASIVIGGYSARELMQKLGTEFVRDQIDPNAWVKSIFARNRDVEDLVISDVRFPNEARSVMHRGGIVVRLNRVTGLPVDEHVSEQRLDLCLVNYEIDNNGSLEHLYAQIDAVLAEHALST